MPSVEETLRSFICSNILFSTDGFPFTNDTSFIDNGIVDSTSVLELVAFIEKQFCISVDDIEVIPENFDSIASLSKYIRTKCK